MNLLGGIRNRINAVVGGVIAAICFLVMGAFLAFVISPQQAVEWRRIQGLPQLDAASYEAVSIGQEVALSGHLQNNSALTPDGLVAYQRDRWDVRPASSSDDSPSGSWTVLEFQFPALSIAVDGGMLRTVAVNNVTIGGNLHETVQDGTGANTDTYQGRKLHDGAVRTRGFADGDLVTMVGQKASTGDAIPARLFGGDRVQLVDNIRKGAQALFLAGIGMMICAPIVLVLGVVGGILGRNRRKLKIG